MIKNLQILRAIAALSVVFFHCDFENIKIGQFGVDIFFVISGFIISFVLNKNQAYFLPKRFIRVIPMYYLFTLTLVAVWLVYPDAFRNVYVSTTAVIKSLLFIPYYVGDSGPILSLGWTLNYEIFFYVTVGFFALILKRPSIALVLAALVIWGVISWQAITDSSNNYLRFYGNQITIEFTFGIFLFYITKGGSQLLKKPSVIFITGFLAIVSFCLMCYFDYHKIYFNRALVFGVPSFFVVLFLILSEDIFDAGHFLHKSLYQIGNASYVVYLCHPFIIYFVIRLINPHLPVNLFFSVLELTIMMSLVIWVSITVHKKIELPAVKFLERVLTKKNVVRI